MTDHKTEAEHAYPEPGSLAGELRTANLLTYLGIAEIRDARDEPTRRLELQIRSRLGLDGSETDG